MMKHYLTFFMQNLVHNKILSTVAQTFLSVSFWRELRCGIMRCRALGTQTGERRAQSVLPRSVTLFPDEFCRGKKQKIKALSVVCFVIGIVLFTSTARSQEPMERPMLLPHGLLFQPLRANIFEPRVGGLVSIVGATERPALRLDIGNSIDLVSFRLSGAAPAEIRIGADFFTFTRLRSEVNFRFPVETTDFFFGMNGSANVPLGKGFALETRLRVAHISAHLVDGFPQYQQSFVYSREFVDAVAAFSQATALGTVRVYAGANLLFHSIPDTFGTATPQLGADARLAIPGVDFLSLQAGYDMKVSTITGSTSLIHSAQAGIKIGERLGHGVLLSAYWYDGKSLHGMFYNQRDNYFGIGFQVE
jgi:hypothetical protein